ncbi:MAG: hypothetical protein ACE5HX_04145 [bacterium]
MAFAAGGTNDNDVSYQISEDLSAKQFYVMKQGTTLKSALLASSAGEVVIGILQDTGLDGSSNVEHGLVRISGESLCKIGGTISVDDPLQADTDGMAIVATTADHVFARALEAGVDGDLIRVHISSEGIF